MSLKEKLTLNRPNAERCERDLEQLQGQNKQLLQFPLNLEGLKCIFSILKSVQKNPSNCKVLLYAINYNKTIILKGNI